MMKHLTSAAALVIAGPAFSQTNNPPSGTAPPMKLSEAQCEVVWARIDIAKAPSVAQSQAEGALSNSNFKIADTNNDGTVSHAEFLVACDKGLVSDTGTGSRAIGPPENTEPKK